MRTRVVAQVVAKDVVMAAVNEDVMINQEAKDVQALEVVILEIEEADVVLKVHPNQDVPKTEPQLVPRDQDAQEDK